MFLIVALRTGKVLFIFVAGNFCAAFAAAVEAEACLFVNMFFEAISEKTPEKSGSFLSGFANVVFHEFFVSVVLKHDLQLVAVDGNDFSIAESVVTNARADRR